MQAVNAVGDSGDSLPVSLIAAALPDAPGAPYLTAADKTSISVAWAAPNDNGSPIVNYQIYYSINLGPYSLLDDAVGATTSYTVASLSTGNNYKFKVFAENGVGEGDISAESDPIIAAIVPDPPTDVARVYSDGNMITIDWVAPVDNGGTPVIDYKVQWDFGLGGAFVEIADSTSGDALYTRSDSVIEGKTYLFKIIAVNAIGDSEPSIPAGIIAAKVPQTPNAPTKKSATTTQIVVQWEEPYDGGSPLTGYQVWWNSGGSGNTFVKLADIAAGTLEHLEDSLTEG